MSRLIGAVNEAIIQTARLRYLTNGSSTPVRGMHIKDNWGLEVRPEDEAERDSTQLTSTAYKALIPR